ncbi:hypothetical protein MRB53_010242 [Persea americana]|uniref:Uncharacterized protein n=1 Tax=Persea americana TaxID=3435 RepID=A0ACC2LRM9_PERAE|nr:hypothetical protein MRB53_010242 [Persea americana]
MSGNSNNADATVKGHELQHDKNVLLWGRNKADHGSIVLAVSRTGSVVLEQCHYISMPPGRRRDANVMEQSLDSRVPQDDSRILHNGSVKT